MIVGIPVGLQCSKLVGLSLFSFGEGVVYDGRVAFLPLDTIRLLISGLPLAIESVITGVLLCITTVGISFGLQQLKLARLALMPPESQIA